MTLNTKVWFGFAPSPMTVLVISRLQVLTVILNSTGALLTAFCVPSGFTGVEVLGTV